MKKKILGLIPSRLMSIRLPMKALLPISGIPLIIHTYKRSKLSNCFDDLIICCDDKRILNIAKKYKAKCMLTSPHHNNGTERICEAYLKLKKKYDLIIDIQGDEPLISPYHIKKVVNFHINNFDSDIVLPLLKISSPNNSNIIKVVTDIKKNVIYMSRNIIPFEFKKKVKYFKKHLSIVSFKPNSLINFSKNKKTPLEEIEDIELLRAVELGMKIKTLDLVGDSFSVDVLNDYENAKIQMSKDKFLKKYE